jgi:hypothetical protein
MSSNLNFPSSELEMSRDRIGPRCLAFIPIILRASAFHIAQDCLTEDSEVVFEWLFVWGTVVVNDHMLAIEPKRLFAKTGNFDLLSRFPLKVGLYRLA